MNCEKYWHHNSNIAIPQIILLSTKDDHHFLKEVLQSQIMRLLLILLWGTYLQNQSDIKMFLLRLILQQIFLQRELHLQMILQYKMVLNKEMLRQDNFDPISGSNEPNPCVIVSAIINSSKCN